MRFSVRRRPVLARGVAGVLMVVAVLSGGSFGTLTPSGASLDVRDAASNAGPLSTAALLEREPTLAGLRLATPDSACAGGFEIDGTARCTPGPDSFALARIGLEGRDETAGMQNPTAETTTGSNVGPSSADAGAIACYGDGREGARIQVIYAYVAGAPNRYGSVLGDIQTTLDATDGVLARSAATTGGVRHFRFVTNSACSLQVADVQLTPEEASNFGATIKALDDRGYNHADRDYLAFVDDTTYCGIASEADDDGPYTDNLDNFGPGYARVDRPCWNPYAPAHELMHTMGAVQLSAPHSTGRYHCTDGADIMCYADHDGVVMTHPCANGDALFDCNHDDYFTTTANPTGYLASHWNCADNVFLETRAGSTTSPGPPLAPPLGRHRRVTDVMTGTLSLTDHLTVFPISVWDGILDAHIDFSGVGDITVRLEDPSGYTLAAWDGPTGQDHTQYLSRGDYRVTVTGHGSVNFQVTATYMKP